MRAVNLLPREATRQRKQLALTPQNTPVVVGAGLGLVVLAGLGIGYTHESGALSSARQELEQAKVQLAHTPKPPTVAPAPQQNAALVGQQSARLTAVSTAVGARVAWDRILREFAQVLPDDVWLTSLSFQTPETPVAGTAPTTGLTISGSTYSHDSVARLLARLALIPELSNVTLQSDSAGAAAAGTTPVQPAAGAPAGGTITFTITAGVELPAGAASLAAPPPPPPPPSTDTTSTEPTS